MSCSESCFATSQRGFEPVSALDLLPAPPTGNWECVGKGKRPPSECGDDSPNQNLAGSATSPVHPKFPIPTRHPHVEPPPEWIGLLRPGPSRFIDPIEAGRWHDLLGLGLVVRLDYTRLATFLDTKYTSLVTARREQKPKGAYRAGNVMETTLLFSRAISQMLSAGIETGICELGRDHTNGDGAVCGKAGSPS